MSEIVSAWGDNSNGQLGDDSTVGHVAPTMVKGLEGVRRIEAGGGHVVALLSDETAVAWGRNTFGQLGEGTTTNQLLPRPVLGLAGIRGIAPGGSHTLFLLEDGTVWGSGAGFSGMLGPANPGICPEPARVEGIDGVVSVVAGGDHALALVDDGSVWSWGRDDHGQLGEVWEPGWESGRDFATHAGRGYPSRSTPAPIRGLSGVRALAAGGAHSAAVLDDGTLLTWGDNDHGQLGDGTTRHRASPARVDGLTEVVAAACACHHTLAVLADGTVHAFGANDRGQLGDGTTTYRARPVKVVGIGGVRAISATGAGGERNPGHHGHSLALLADGTVLAWGCNDHGELGDGGNRDRLVARPVHGLSAVRQVTSGGGVLAAGEHPGGGYTLAIHLEDVV